MEKLAVASAKCVWLINLVEMNPKGLRLFPNLVDYLTDLYDFDEQPDEPAGVTPSYQQGLKFKNGQFETEEGMVRVSLELYDDGIVADSSVSTGVTNKFIKHAINSATTAFGLEFHPHLVMNELHNSELVVRFDSRLAGSLPILTKFSDALSATALNGAPQAFYPSGITFTTANGALQFTLDRRANSPMDANVFYSKAPTDTLSHLLLLTTLDDVLAGRESHDSPLQLTPGAAR